MVTRRDGHGSELIAQSWNAPVGGRNGKKHPEACACTQLDDSKGWFLTALYRYARK
jgi:hypothetical protein